MKEQRPITTSPGVPGAATRIGIGSFEGVDGIAAPPDKTSLSSSAKSPRSKRPLPQCPRGAYVAEYGSVVPPLRSSTCHRRFASMTSLIHTAGAEPWATAWCGGVGAKPTNSYPITCSPLPTPPSITYCSDGCCYARPVSQRGFSTRRSTGDRSQEAGIDFSPTPRSSVSLRFAS